MKKEQKKTIADSNSNQPEEFIVNPYEVKGSVNYEKLIKEFGLSEIDEKLLNRIKKITNKPLHPMLKRKVFLAHRDLNKILDEYEKGNKFYLYTGRGPSGKMHLGHLLPLMFTKYLQDAFDVELYFQITDDEKFLFKKDLDFETIEKYTYENLLDIIALGFDPKKTHIIIDTKHISILYKQALKVAKKINFSTIKSVFGFDNDTNIGSIFFTSMQTVPSFLASVIKGKNIPCLIPHAIDQDNHFRISRDVLPKLGYLKPASIECVFLPQLSGESKLSSSQGIAIYTTDTHKEVKKKINKYAFSGGKDTIELHRKYGGNCEIDISYQYLKMFFESNDKKLLDIKEKYEKGELLSGELKNILIEKINLFLEEHQKKREEAKNKINEYLLNVEEK